MKLNKEEVKGLFTESDGKLKKLNRACSNLAKMNGMRNTLFNKVKTNICASKVNVDGKESLKKESLDVIDNTIQELQIALGEANELRKDVEDGFIIMCGGP